MVYDSGFEYVKGNTIPHVNAISRIQFNKCQKEKKNENPGWGNIALGWNWRIISTRIDMIRY